MSVPARQKLHSIVILGVAAAFQWFFMFTKHDPDLRAIIPFGDDPYDALGSFATIVNILLCLLLLWRSFHPMRGLAPSPAATRIPPPDASCHPSLHPRHASWRRDCAGSPSAPLAWHARPK